MNNKKSEVSTSASEVSLVQSAVANLDLLVENTKTQRDFYHNLASKKTDKNEKAWLGVVADKLHEFAMTLQNDVVALKSALVPVESKFDAGIACVECGVGVVKQLLNGSGAYCCAYCGAKFDTIESALNIPPEK